MGPGAASAFTRVFDALWAGTTGILCLPPRVGADEFEDGPAVAQILSGNLMMKLPRLGSFTLGSVCASMVSFSPMNLLSENT
jgi:hypothetical protein